VYVRPLTLKQANTYISTQHRHHGIVRGHRFSLGAYVGEIHMGTIIVGRPIARNTCQYTVAEVTRLATNGYPNACSFLYGRAAKACKAMGYTYIQTFILDSETGISLKASGWKKEHITLADGSHWKETRIAPQICLFEEEEPIHIKAHKRKWSKSLNMERIEKELRRNRQ